MPVGDDGVAAEVLKIFVVAGAANIAKSPQRAAKRGFIEQPVLHPQAGAIPRLDGDRRRAVLLGPEMGSRDLRSPRVR